MIQNDKFTSNKIAFSIIERLMLLENMDIYNVKSNIEASDLTYRIIPAISFTDEEIKEYKIIRETWGGDRERFSELADIELPIHILKDMFNKYIHHNHAIETFFILRRILNVIKNNKLDEDGNYDDVCVYTGDTEDVVFNTLSDIVSFEKIVYGVMRMNEQQWALMAQGCGVTVDDIKTLVKFLSCIMFTDKEIDDFEINQEKQGDLVKVISNIDDDPEKLNKLLTRHVNTALRDEFINVIYKFGFNNMNYKLFQRLNIMRRDDLYYNSLEAKV